MATFKDFLLKEELLRAVKEAGFERPSEVQFGTIPNALNGRDILCQAKAGTGKTPVFVLSILNQMTKDTPPISALILCNTRELAYQIKKEFSRLGKYLNYKMSVYYGGVPEEENRQDLRTNQPHVIVGTPGRILSLVKTGALKLDKLRYFVIDECDNVLAENSMRSDVQEIFTKSPHEKQVMMFSGTLPDPIRHVCRKFMQDQFEIIVEDNSKLVLHGLDQYHVSLAAKKKIDALVNILSTIPFNQVIIFVNQIERAKALSKHLILKGFNNICMYKSLSQNARIDNYDEFKKNNKRIMVATDIFGRGIDIERVNLVINFDMPRQPETYMHRVGRAGRFETKGVAISFLENEEEKEVLNEIQTTYGTQITAMTKEIESTFLQ